MTIEYRSTSTKLGEPITGPGRWTRRSLQRRAKRVEQCWAEGPPVFETVKPPGYDHPLERCTRCKCLKKHHRLPQQAV